MQKYKKASATWLQKPILCKIFASFIPHALKGRVFKIKKSLCAVLSQITWQLRRRYKGRCADIWRSPEAKHCSSLCSQSEGDEYCGGQARAKNPTKICPRALAIFATCSWPSLCEQSELQCWRRNRRLCGPVQISAARALPLTFDILILNTLSFRGAVASLPILIFPKF